MFVILDIKSGKQATKTTYQSRMAASKTANAMDMKYGAVRYVVRAVGI